MIFSGVGTIMRDTTHCIGNVRSSLNTTGPQQLLGTCAGYIQHLSSHEQRALYLGLQVSL